MKRKIEGKCAIAQISKGGAAITVRGNEHCNLHEMQGILGIIEACGFTKVTSHSAMGLDTLGDGTNVLSVYTDSMDGIVNSMSRPKSVIVVPVSLTGSQTDTHIKSSTITAACKSAIENEYRDSTGTVIVGGGRVIGVYITARNLLVTRDITHNSDGPIVLGKLLTELLKYKAHYNIGGAGKVGIPMKMVKAFDKIDKKIMIGLDPEMGLLNKQGKFVGSPYRGSEIGRDAGDVIELRPKPGSVKDVITNVRALYKSMDKTLGKNLRLVSGGGKVIDKPLGGHIHFNIPNHGSLTTLLDEFIGKPMQSINGSERVVGGHTYGRLGAIARKTHGFEYRTPPSFLGKPDLFAGVIALAFCVASTWKTICNSGSTFEYGCDEKTGAYAKEYEKLTYYTRYKKHINAFLEYVNSDELSMEETDVLAAWAIREAVCLEDVAI